MPQSSTLSVGMDVHKDSIDGASVAQEHHDAVVSLGHIGPRQCDIDQLLRRLQAQNPHLVFVSAAGPCGSWLYRYLTTKGQVCWVVASSLIPTKSGDRVKTNRRAALTLARLMRSGDLTPVSVPPTDYLEVYHTHHAQPYRWTYTGQPLVRATPFSQTRRQQRQGRAWFSPRPKPVERACYPPRPYKHSPTSLVANL
jgi:hypothetical protein